MTFCLQLIVLCRINFISTPYQEELKGLCYSCSTPSNSDRGDTARIILIQVSSTVHYHKSSVPTGTLRIGSCTGAWRCGVFLARPWDPIPASEMADGNKFKVCIVIILGCWLFLTVTCSELQTYSNAGCWQGDLLTPLLLLSFLQPQ